MSVLPVFKKIKTFVLDVDGVLTDSSILILDKGNFARRMNIKDGYALQLAIKKGYRILVISGGTSEAVKVRLEKLGIQDIHLNISDKTSILQQYVEQHGLLWDEVLYMGDDIPDYKVMKLVGLACCPADAVPEIKDISHYISPAVGGEGCVRDVIEKVLKLNNHWRHDDETTSL